MAHNREGKGVIFNIQRCSTQDGPGIRTTVFLKGCSLRCFWCQNPESQMAKPEIFLYKDKCTSCGRCVEVCLTGANSLLGESSTIDRDECIGCGRCTEVCPNDARSLVGNQVTVDEVTEEVLRDKRFYENSGGGVTLSGGEPTAQPEFALALLRRCKKERLHTVLDTCGYVSWPILKKLLRYTDLVLYDIKCIDSNKHYEATGVPNEIILENAKMIAQGKRMSVRVPVIPGFNDSIQEVMAIAHFVKEELASVDIDLLHYNKMGESKYQQLERAGVHLQDKGEDHLEMLRAVVSFPKKKIETKRKISIP
ncbi:MAG: glycyl-radical enzyme activating protein [Deltaproteobacteria bacterium]|nr:glycyl-radical enzyme activating protein [Deltaproteobacteria bacterium]